MKRWQLCSFESASAQSWTIRSLICLLLMQTRAWSLSSSSDEDKWRADEQKDALSQMTWALQMTNWHQLWVNRWLLRGSAWKRKNLGNSGEDPSGKGITWVLLFSWFNRTDPLLLVMEHANGPAVCALQVGWMHFAGTMQWTGEPWATQNAGEPKSQKLRTKPHRCMCSPSENLGCMYLGPQQSRLMHGLSSYFLRCTLNYNNVAQLGEEMIWASSRTIISKSGSRHAWTTVCFWGWTRGSRLPADLGRRGGVVELQN